MVQRDLAVCWLFTGTFPTPLADGTLPLQRLAGCCQKFCPGLGCGHVPGQVELYGLSSWGVFGHWPVAFHGEELAGLGILVHRGGFFGGDGGIGGAELDSSGVLHRVLAGFNFKGRVARFDEPNVGARFGFAGPVGRGPAAADAAGTEEREGHHQQNGPDDDGGVVHREEGPKGKCSHQGDVDPCQHDAESTGTAESRGGEALGTSLFLGGLLGQRAAALFTEHAGKSLGGHLSSQRVNAVEKAVSSLLLP